MTVLVASSLRRSRVRCPSVRRLIRQVLIAIGETAMEVGVTFVGDRRMRGLNRRFRGLDRTTDVLAFAGREAIQPPTGFVVLGDVVVSVPQAARQARAAGHTLDQELAMLLVHGLLHLCGYDHERGAQEARRMFRRQRDILIKVGRPPVLLSRRSLTRSGYGVV